MTQRETAKEIAARIRAGEYRPWFTPTVKGEGDLVFGPVSRFRASHRAASRLDRSGFNRG